MTAWKVGVTLCWSVAVAGTVVSFSSVGQAHDWMAPKHASQLNNPIPSDERSITSGKGLYLDNCAACHGVDAKGLDVGKVGLEQSPPNLIKRIQTHTAGDFYWKIQEGRGDMPSFKDELTDTEIWDVINSIRNETKK